MVDNQFYLLIRTAALTPFLKTYQLQNVQELVIREIGSSLVSLKYLKVFYIYTFFFGFSTDY